MNKAKPPYYAVIFTSKLKDRTVGYEETAQEMFDLAKSQPGFFGFKSVRQELGITISYWKSIEDILLWKKHTKHQVAQNKGINEWYASYDVEICLVERVYSM